MHVHFKDNKTKKFKTLQSLHWPYLSSFQHSFLLSFVSPRAEKILCMACLAASSIKTAKDSMAAAVSCCILAKYIHSRRGQPAHTHQRRLLLHSNHLQSQTLHASESSQITSFDSSTRHPRLFSFSWRRSLGAALFFAVGFRSNIFLILVCFGGREPALGTRKEAFLLRNLLVRLRRVVNVENICATLSKMHKCHVQPNHTTTPHIPLPELSLTPPFCICDASSMATVVDVSRRARDF